MDDGWYKHWLVGVVLSHCIGLEMALSELLEFSFTPAREQFSKELGADCLLKKIDYKAYR